MFVNYANSLVDKFISCLGRLNPDNFILPEEEIPQGGDIPQIPLLGSYVLPPCVVERFDELDWSAGVRGHFGVLSLGNGIDGQPPSGAQEDTCQYGCH